MATIKNTSNVLGNLVNLINGAIPQSNGYSTGNLSLHPINIDDDSIPSGMLDMEPVFDINYKSTKKQCYKKAKTSVLIIVKAVVPLIMQETTMIKDKIELDGEQLGNLYYEYAKGEVMILALMETISRGETQARLFEVYTKMTDQQQKLSSKITETQNQMRKYYIDTYLDLQEKDSMDDNIGIGTQKQKPGIAAPEEVKEEVKDNVIMGTENVVKMLEEKKKKAMIAKYQEIKDSQ